MKHKQSITLEQWACKAKRILEDAFHKDAIWTPTLELFISECPATNPTNPVVSTDHVFRLDDVASGNPVDFAKEKFAGYDTSEYETRPTDYDDIPSEQRYGFSPK